MEGQTTSVPIGLQTTSSRSVAIRVAFNLFFGSFLFEQFFSLFLSSRLLLSSLSILHCSTICVVDQLVCHQYCQYCTKLGSNSIIAHFHQPRTKTPSLHLIFKTTALDRPSSRRQPVPDNRRHDHRVEEVELLWRN